MANKSKHCLALSVNAGSSSLKISAFCPLPEKNLSSFDHSSNQEPVRLLLTASFENLSSPPSLFTFHAESEEISTESKKNEKVEDVIDHEGAFNHFLDFLQRSTKFDRDDINKICHRVVHGGDYEHPVIISNESYHHIESLSDLAPL
jgi:acetate kinase